MNKEEVNQDEQPLDEAKAAEQYRLHQARKLMENLLVTVTHEGVERQMSYYDMVNSEALSGSKGAKTTNSDEGEK